MAAHPSVGGAPLKPAPPTANRPKPRQYKYGVRATERDCQATVVAAAHTLGYRVLAIRPAQTQTKRWLSPIQGDAGYPDLTLVHPAAGVLFVELKRPPNGLEPAQQAWGEAFIAAGAIWRVIWVPEQLDEFVQELADRTRRQVTP